MQNTIYELSLKDFSAAPFAGMLGPAFDNYSTIGIKHSTGKIIDIIFDETGFAVEEENPVTDRIKAAFTSGIRKARIARCIIDGMPCLALKIPEII